MRAQLIAVGTRMPAWVKAGFEEYVARLPREWGWRTREIALARKNTDPAAMRRDEGERMLAALRPGVRLIALDMAGRQWDTPELSRRLAGWLADGRDMVFAIGGPDGLDGAVLERAELAWSLSALTFPHAVVRILVVEQLYRAWSILRNHPYHRA